MSFHRRIHNICLPASFIRHISNDSSISEKVLPKRLTRKRQKIIVTRRSISADKERVASVEWKKAADIIKKLNFENKHLFGPILSSKPGSYDERKMQESNQIIQHQTEIPILDSYADKCDLDIPPNEVDEIYHTISSFPLINKMNLPKGMLQAKIDEMNIMRNFLQLACLNSSMPSVSSILEKTMPKERRDILENWKINMIKQLGEEGFEKYHKELLSNGADLHSCINSFLTSAPESELVIKENITGYWKSLKPVFPYIKDVRLLEEFLTHPFLCYKGVVDCFAMYKHHLVVIDWKTSKKSKALIKNTFDNPLQIAAYVGALNFDPKYQYLATKGLIVVAYESGLPATVHLLDESDMLKYWKDWLSRLQQFWKMKIDEIKNIQS